MNIIKVLAAVVLTALTAANAMALDKPTGDVILTVTGHVANKNAPDGAQFDAAMLDQLAARSGQMETPWTTGKVTFSGPLLKAVLEAAGAEGTTLTVKAMNDYTADVPIEDARAIDTMLAMRMDGKIMSVRDKGPLFLVYPFDTQPELYNEKYFARSVWQIKEIDVH
jgi:hypothetical protein